MSAVPAELGPGSAGAGAWYRRHSGAIGYAVAGLAVWIGWLLTRDAPLMDSKDGIGYWIGIIGASLMGILLLYPVRKRLRFMRYLGATRHWFRAHMIFGVVGPVLILYHSNFAFGSLNSNVALVCTLLVAGSGLVGRYFYRKIHTDLDGHKASLKQLSESVDAKGQEGARTSRLIPELLERMTVYDKLVLAPPHSLLATILLPVKLAFETRWLALRLVWLARRQLKERARRSPVIAAERDRLQAKLNRYIFEHMRRVRRVAEFSSYERLFSLWHVFHLPFFYMLVVTAIVHVVAVHMY